MLIDCLEFRDDFRRIDAAADVAFLAMDLVYRRRPGLAARLLAIYAREADDFDLYHVIDYFMSYRAAVRAKVATLAAEDSALDAAQRAGAAGSARRHLALSARALEGKSRAAVVALCGKVGTGKSTVAELVADELGGAAISSDRVRKRLAGLSVTSHTKSAWSEGLYSPERTREVYEGLFDRAAPIVESGRVAVLDATFATRQLREPLRRWAGERRVPAFLVETRCAGPRVLERLARREAEGRDPSEAGPAEYAQSDRGFERPEEWPRGGRWIVRTDVPSWKRQVRARVQRLRARLRS